MQAGKPVGILSNSEGISSEEAGKKGVGLSSMSERGTTQRMVKAPKCLLSVLKVLLSQNSQEVGLEAAIL